MSNLQPNQKTKGVIDHEYFFKVDFALAGHFRGNLFSSRMDLQGWHQAPDPFTTPGLACHRCQCGGRK